MISATLGETLGGTHNMSGFVFEEYEDFNSTNSEMLVWVGKSTGKGRSADVQTSEHENDSYGANFHYYNATDHAESSDLSIDEDNHDFDYTDYDYEELYLF